MHSSTRGARAAVRAATMFLLTAFAGTATGTPVLHPDVPGGGNDVVGRCMLFAHSDRSDPDNDGYRNACDPDFNNDGVVNFIDLAMLRERFYTNDLDVVSPDEGMVRFSDLAYLTPGALHPGGPIQLTPRGGRGIPVSAPATSALLLAGLLGWRAVRRLRA